MTRGGVCDDADAAITSKRPERCCRCCQRRVLRPRLRARANEARGWQPRGRAAVWHRLSAAARHQGGEAAREASHEERPAEQQGGLGADDRRRCRQRGAPVGQRAHRLGRCRAAPHHLGPHQGQRRREGHRLLRRDGALSQHDQSAREDPQGFHGQGSHRPASGEGLDPGRDAADGLREGVRRRPAHQTRSPDRVNVASGRHGGTALWQVGDYGAPDQPAVPVPAARGSEGEEGVQLLRRAGWPGDVQLGLHDVDVPQREPAHLQGVR